MDSKTGIDSTGAITNTISGATFDRGADGFQITLPADATYTLTLTSTTGLPAQLVSAGYLVPQGNVTYEMESQATFLDIPFTVNGTAAALLDLTGALPALSLTLRNDSGAVIATRSPDSVLDQNGLADAIAPVTQIAVREYQDALGCTTGR